MTSSLHSLIAADAATVSRQRSRRAPVFDRFQRTRTARERPRSTFPSASVPRAQTL
jgi:hypothetical protein